MDKAQRIQLFVDSVRCCHALSFWVLGESRILESDDAFDPAGDMLLSAHDRQTLWTAVKTSPHPVIFTADVGLTWVAVRDKDNAADTYILGPFYLGDNAGADTLHLLQRRGLKQADGARAAKYLRSLPSLSLGRTYE